MLQQPLVCMNVLSQTGIETVRCGFLTPIIRVHFRKILMVLLITSCMCFKWPPTTHQNVLPIKQDGVSQRVCRDTGKVMSLDVFHHHLTKWDLEQPCSVISSTCAATLWSCRCLGVFHNRKQSNPLNKLKIYFFKIYINIFFPLPCHIRSPKWVLPSRISE